MYSICMRFGKLEMRGAPGILERAGKGLSFATDCCKLWLPPSYPYKTRMQNSFSIQRGRHLEFPGQ